MLATLVMTVAVFTFVLLLGNALKEILTALVNRQATLGGVIEAFALLVPWVTAFALPMGMLTAALLVFGRFSADQELTAVRSSGISLVALITPIQALSLLLCGLCAYINMEVAPLCRVAYKKLLISMGASAGAMLFPEGQSVQVKDSHGENQYIVFVSGNDGHNLRDAYIYKLGPDQKVDTIIFAPSGWYENTNHLGTNLTHLHLDEARQVKVDGGDWNTVNMGGVDKMLDFNQKTQAAERPSLDNMTFRQLQAELKDLDAKFNPPNAGSLSPDVNVRRRELELRKREITMPVLVQMHRQVAFSFACFGFTLVGIPLGIRAHRRETNIGIAMALGLVAVYYSFVIVSQSLETHAGWWPHLIVWIPNFIFQAVGAVMLWRANRGG